MKGLFLFTLAAAIAGALTSCGLDPDYMKPRIAKLSDKDLLHGYQVASTAMRPLNNPQEQWFLDEMKRRGLVGPGRDGVPAR